MIEAPDMAALTALLHRTAIELGDGPAAAPIGSVFVCWDAVDEHWTITAQLPGRFGKDGELADIDDIRAWAQALGGHLLLSDPEPYGRTSTRRHLCAVKPICAGVLLEVSADIARTRIPETTPA